MPSWHICQLISIKIHTRTFRLDAASQRRRHTPKVDSWTLERVRCWQAAHGRVSDQARRGLHHACKQVFMRNVNRTGIIFTSVCSIIHLLSTHSPTRKHNWSWQYINNKCANVSKKKCNGRIHGHTFNAKTVPNHAWQCDETKSAGVPTR